MVPNPSSPSWESISIACKEVLSTNTCQLWGEFKREVAKRLEVSVDDIKEWNTEMKKIIAGGESGEDSKEDINDGNEEVGKGSRGEEDGDSQDDDKAVSSDEEEARVALDKGKRTDGEEESAAMKAFKLMARAMSLGYVRLPLSRVNLAWCLS